MWQLRDRNWSILHPPVLAFQDHQWASQEVQHEVNVSSCLPDTFGAGWQQEAHPQPQP